MKPVTFEYRPLPVFESFHSSTARERWCVGGYGSGKSVAACAEMIAWGLEQPGSEFLITRKTVPALRDTTEKTFVDLLPPDFFRQCDVGRAGGHLEHVTFPTGSTYYMRSMDDWKKHRSMNLAGILWDEADEFTPDEMEGMNSRLRQTKPTARARELGYKTITRRGHVLASNPQGHNWLYERYVPHPYPNSAYFVSTTLDNPHLPKDYVESLLAMPDPWVKRYVLCNFDDFGGSIYGDWSYETHVVPPYERFDPANFFIMGFDPGTSAGNAALWCYYDREKHCYVAVDEYLESGLAASKHAKEWRRIEARRRMNVRERIADPKAIGVRDRGSNMKLSDQYRRLGFTFREGINSPKDRVPALGQLIFQGRFKVTTDCMRTFDQIKNYRWEDLTPAQVEKGKEANPLKKNVDLVDAAQYIAGRYMAAAKVHAAEEDLTDAEYFAREVAKAIRKQLGRKNATGEHDLGSITV